MSADRELLELHAARYRELRQQFKNHEVSLELWGRTFNGEETVGGEDALDDYVDASIAAKPGGRK